MSKNIWQIAGQLSEAHLKSDSHRHSSTLVVVGSKNGGKTTIVNRFTDRSQAPKPTLALEYSFARRQRKDEAATDVCNVWELGGGVLFTNLIEFAISEDNLDNTCLVLVLDLSTPEELIITAETLLNSIRQHIDKILSKKSKAKIESCLKERAVQRFGGDHEDNERVNPFPIPLIVIGSKYDIFQDLDPEKKKLIVRYLRIMSHSMAAQLMFTSNKSEALMNRCRNALNNLLFGTAMETLGFHFDYTKPIAIPFGSDSFQKIGYESIDVVKRMYVSTLAQVVTELVIPDDPAKDVNFKERDIDLIRSQKDGELEAYKRKLEIKHKSRLSRI